LLSEFRQKRTEILKRFPRLSSILVATNRLASPGNRVFLVLEQVPNAFDDLNILFRVHTSPRPILSGAQDFELLLPVAENVRFVPHNVADLSDGIIEFLHVGLGRGPGKIEVHSSFNDDVGGACSV
jgi:hypothetical protein